MKSKSLIICALGALMAITAVDNVPDPPAVNPHTVSVASRLCEARGGVCDQRLDFDLCCTSTHLQIRWIAFAPAYEPNLPGDRIVLTGQAADPSPPSLQASRNL
jgi:hypothetical protein